MRISNGMTIYERADRERQRGPGGIDIWVIPGRAVVTATVAGAKIGEERGLSDAALLTHLRGYFTGHTTATADDLITPGAAAWRISVYLRRHPDLFEPCGRRAHNAQLWRVRKGGAP